MPQDKTLPQDYTDSSLPGRLEEGSSGYLPESSKKPKNRKFWAIAVAMIVVSGGIFSYYIANQEQIDSRIIQSTINSGTEQNLVARYGVGEYGSDHAHAAIAVFIEDQRLNFALPQFQLTSKYIHFENHNSYLIHKHATGVPLDMLFASFGVKITQNCIILNSESGDKEANKLCSGDGKSLAFFVNGNQYPDISQYEIKHNDRILISFGDDRSIPRQIDYLESLRIPGVPKENPQISGNEIIV